MKLIYTMLAVMAGFFVSAMALAGESMLASDGEMISFIITLLIDNAGQFGVVDWLLLVVVLAHVSAIVYVNVTHTPVANTLYGKIYSRLIEPLAGVLIKSRAKESAKDEWRL